MKNKQLFLKILIAFCIAIQACIPFLLMSLQTIIINYAFNININALYNLAIYLLLTLLNILITTLEVFLTKRITIKNERIKNEELLKKLSKIKINILEADDGRQCVYRSLENIYVENDILKNNITIITALSQLISYFIYIGLNNYYVLLFALVMMIVGAILNIIISKKTDNFWPKYVKRMKLANYFSNILVSKDTANEKKIFDYYNYFNDKYINEHKAACNENKHHGLRRFSLELIQELASLFFTFGTCLIMFQLTLSNRLSISVFISIFLALIPIYSLILTTCSSFFSLSINKKKTKEWDNFLQLEEYNYENNDHIIDNDKITISIENLYFKYPNSKNYVIKDFTYNFVTDQQYALVGENGCGKSTLVKLLLGLYPYNEGSIKINGIELNQFSRNQLNHIFSVVFQKFYSFPVTIGELLKINANIKSNIVNDVLKKLNLYALIEKLPEKFNTSLSLEEDGKNFSGGELQKLAIARAILKNSPFIILDEPNSALDPISESETYKLYHESFKQKCSILITHRLGATKAIENILVMKDGKIMASGSHNYLMKNCDYYNKMYSLQKEMYING